MLGLLACIGGSNVYAEAFVLRDAQLDAVVAGQAVRPAAVTVADARAEGRNAFSYTRTFAAIDVSEETPALSTALSSTYVTNYGVAYATGRGPGASHNAVTAGLNQQAGPTAGPGLRIHNHVGRHSSYSVVSGSSVTSHVIDRHAMIQRHRPW